MNDPHILLSFLLTCVIIEVTPGPNMTYLAILSLSDGKRAGLSAVAGVALGLLSVGLIASAGMASVIVESPPLYELLRWAGVVYLLYLSWAGWKDDQDSISGKMNSERTPAAFFMRGLVTNLLNPKAFILYVAILPQFVVVKHAVLMQTLGLTLLYVMTATSVHVGIVLLAAKIRPFLQHSGHMRLTRRILSALLAVVALWIAIETQR